MVETIVLQYQNVINPDVPRIEASRGIMNKNHQCLMVHIPEAQAYMTPGGGIEVGETFEECLIREFQEETGYIIEKYEAFLIVEEHFDDCIYVNHYYVVAASKQGLTSHTVAEREQQLESVWINESDLHDLLLKPLPIVVRTMHTRELIVWNQYLKNIQNKHA